MSLPGTVALVDYGAGNLRSVENALREVGAAVVVTRDPEAVRRADRVVVPGQGSMPACAEAMRASGVEAALREQVARGAPVLGICVGLQVLFERGEEAGGALEGLEPGDGVHPHADDLGLGDVGEGGLGRRSGRALRLVDGGGHVRRPPSWRRLSSRSSRPCG